MKPRHDHRRFHDRPSLPALAFVAPLLFIPLFVYKKIGSYDFWTSMSIILVVLNGLAIFDRRFRQSIDEDFRSNLSGKMMQGLLSTVFLFIVFVIGNWASRHFLPFAAGNIDAIYSLKGSAPLSRIGLLLVLVIGPGEELFWRGYLQREMANRFGPAAAFIFTAFLYAGIHLASRNFMLTAAALVCGFFWGWLYLRYRSIVLNMVSHTVWDLAVFLLFPFTG